jgi:cytochrome c oxidase assembly protein Cox11
MKKKKPIPKKVFWSPIRIFSATVLVLMVAYLMAIGVIPSYRFWTQDTSNSIIFSTANPHSQNKVDYLRSLKVEYDSTTASDQKSELRIMILNAADDLDGDVPQDLQTFVSDLKTEAK